MTMGLVSLFIKQRYSTLKYLLSVCTGSTMIAATGILDGRKATSNKMSWSFATSNKAVHWVAKARWVVDGKYYTSSGVSAGMDMTLGFLNDTHGHAFAKEVADQIEYTWQEDKDHDDFCR